MPIRSPRHSHRSKGTSCPYYYNHNRSPAFPSSSYTLYLTIMHPKYRNLVRTFHPVQSQISCFLISTFIPFPHLFDKLVPPNTGSCHQNPLCKSGKQRQRRSISGRAHPATPIIPKTYGISQSGTLGVRFNAFPISHSTGTSTSISGLIYCVNSITPPPPPGTPPDFIGMYNTLFYAAFLPPVPPPGRDI